MTITYTVGNKSASRNSYSEMLDVKLQITGACTSANSSSQTRKQVPLPVMLWDEKTVTTKIMNNSRLAHHQFKTHLHALSPVFMETQIPTAHGCHVESNQVSQPRTCKWKSRVRARLSHQLQGWQSWCLPLKSLGKEVSASLNQRWERCAITNPTS